MSSTNLLNPLSRVWNKAFLFVLFTLFALSSCAFLSGNIKQSTESQKDFEAIIKTEGFYVRDVIIKKSFDSDIVKENAEYALSILVPERETSSDKKMGADIVLKEESFIKGFEQLNTVSLELIVRDVNENTVKRILVSEETENTLSSYRYLYKILEKGIREAGL